MGIESPLIFKLVLSKYSESPSLYSQAASQVVPSPAGEGWGEENKIKAFLISPLIQPSPSGEGFHREIK